MGDFVSPGLGGLSRTQDILFHPDGRVLVTGVDNTDIKTYDASGNYLGSFNSDYSLLGGPTKMVLGFDSLIYVSQWGLNNNEVVRFNLDGTFHSEFTNDGNPRGLGIVFDKKNRLLIAQFADGNNGIVKRYDSQGNLIDTIINSSVLQGPTHLFIMENMDILVQDWSVGAIRQFDSLGTYKGIWANGLGQPEGIVQLPDKSFLLGDWSSDVIRQVDSAGSNIGIWASGNGLNDPNAVVLKEVTLSNLKSKTDNKIFVYSYNDKLKSRIKMQISQSDHLKFDLISMNGEIRQLELSGFYESGSYELDINSSNNIPGVYLLQITGRNLDFKSKLVLR